MMYADTHNLNDGKTLVAAVPHIMPDILRASFDKHPGGIAQPEEGLSIIEYMMSGRRKMELPRILTAHNKSSQTKQHH